MSEERDRIVNTRTGEEIAFRVVRSNGWGIEGDEVIKWHQGPDGIRHETRSPLDWFYISFADETGFLGGVYIAAGSAEEAYFLATLRCINPGGEVQIVGPLDREELDANVPPEDRERLLTRAEVEG